MRRYFPLMALGLALAITQVAMCADGNPAYTSASEAGVDYTMQGEYAGTDVEDHKWGAQVIALGDGQFDVIGYLGGLPGDGWKRGDEQKRGKGALKDGKVQVTGNEWTATIDGESLVVISGDGKEVAKLKKVNRESPTLGAKAPEGAIVLFDGTTADNFNNGKLIEEKLLAASNPESKQKLCDHTLHIEFRTPFMPKSRGQARGNSGVYLQSRYEVQVLDSFGLDGKDNECGGIYQASQPIVNMCLPPLAWQTYDIEFTSAKYEGDKKISNAKVTVKHNGVTIHEGLELKNGTPGRAKEGPENLGLYLQDHGNPVAFRNIWVVEKK